MANDQGTLLPQAMAEGSAPTISTVQEVHSLSAHHGNAILAGGNVSFQTNHYHGYSHQPINIVEVLRLVPNLRKIHLDVLSKATPGTAIWVLPTEYFLLWLDSNGNLKILWGTGIPGAGKSVMASVVINYLEERAAASSGSVCVAYVYFRYSDAADLTVRGVLEILVKQIVERHADCARLAEEVYARHVKERTQPTQAELLQLLHRFTELKTVTFYVLDALDEAPEKLRVGIVRTLASLNVKLFITSRPLSAIVEKLPDTYSFNIVAQDGDLDLHIQQEISWSEELEDLLDADPSFKDEVILLVKQNCGGMFLHASLQLDAICRCTSAQDILDTLADFPPDLAGVYRQTWRRILAQTVRNVLLAKAVLVWVINAARPMTIEELRRAVATHPDTHKFEPKRLAPAATLLTLCCGLIIVEEETKLVRLIHYTAKDILVELLEESFPHPDSLLSAVCITHLTGCGFQDTKIDSEEEFATALQDDPLLAYASEAWSIHVRRSLDVPSSRQRAASFVSQCKAFPCFTHPSRADYFDLLPPLHLCALYHLPLSLSVAETVGDPNTATKKTGMTVLALASWRGNVDITRILLGQGISHANSDDEDGWPEPTLTGLKETAEVLAHTQIQVNLVGHDGYSALMLATSCGHEAIVKALLARPDIQVNLVENEGSSVLVLAAERGHEGIVKALLAHPDIQVNLVDNEGSSALIWATDNGHEGVAKALLAHPDIQVNLVESEGSPALAVAAYHGHTGIAKALLAHHEIQVNLVHKGGLSALMVAASRGHEGIVQALLAHPEIQVNLLHKSGLSALVFATSQGHQRIAQVLLAHPEIQVNLAHSSGLSALMVAASQGREGIAKALLAHPDIEVNLVDTNGFSALMLAASEGHHGIVGLLLSHPEIQMDISTRDGATALTLAQMRGHSAVVDLFSHWSHQDPEAASASTFRDTPSTPQFGGRCATNFVGLGRLPAHAGLVELTHIGSDRSRAESLPLDFDID